MVGTLYNAIAVGIGASAGLWLGKKISKELENHVFQALGLFTLGIGFSMSMEMDQPFAVFWPWYSAPLLAKICASTNGCGK